MPPKKIRDLDAEQGDKVLAGVRKPPFSIPNVSVFSAAPAGDRSTLPLRPRPHQRFANELAGGFAEARPDHHLRQPYEPPVGLFAHKPPPQPPGEAYRSPPSCPPAPSAPRPAPIVSTVRHGSKFPRVNWVGERQNSIKSTARPGAAAYYHRSYQFRSIKRKWEEQVPGGEKDTGIRSTVQKPDKLVMIFGLTNVRRANAQTKVNAKLQKFNRRSKFMRRIRGEESLFEWD